MSNNYKRALKISSKEADPSSSFRSNVRFARPIVQSFMDEAD